VIFSSSTALCTKQLCAEKIMWGRLLRIVLRVPTYQFRYENAVAALKIRTQSDIMPAIQTASL
jgi:hypothetical protein